MMTMTAVKFYFVLCCMIVILYRNNIVYKARCKALDIISEKTRKAIDNDGDWQEIQKQYTEYGSYLQMLFDFGKWKFEDFYPDL